MQLLPILFSIGRSAQQFDPDERGRAPRSYRSRSPIAALLQFLTVGDHALEGISLRWYLKHVER